MANEENLLKGNPATQFKAGREQVDIAKQGGIASGVAKREHKRVAQLYAEILDKKLKLNINGVEKEINGQDYIKECFKRGYELTPIAAAKELRTGVDNEAGENGITFENGSISVLNILIARINGEGEN